MFEQIGNLYILLMFGMHMRLIASRTPDIFSYIFFLFSHWEHTFMYSLALELLELDISDDYPHQCFEEIRKIVITKTYAYSNI